MQFGQWELLVRKERALDLRSIAARTGVDATTISRIERGSQATLPTVIRLSEGLGISLSDLLFALEGKRFTNVVEYSQSSKVEVMPTMEDIRVFLTFLHSDLATKRAWLATLLNRIAFMSESKEDKKRFEDSQQLFVSQDIDKLLRPSSFYQFVLQYPPQLQAEVVVDIYKNGGILLSTDIGMYTRQARQNKQATLSKIEDTTQLSVSTLSRLETGSMERIKFHDIILLDKYLDQDGMIIGMYWNASHFELEMLGPGFIGNEQKSPLYLEQEMKMVHMFILICRWLQALSSDTVWIEELREQFQHQHI